MQKSVKIHFAMGKMWFEREIEATKSFDFVGLSKFLLTVMHNRIITVG